MTDLDRVEATAVEAAAVGGEYLLEASRRADLSADYRPDDVKSEADRESERRVLSVVREAFPGHPVTAEESGDHDGDPDADLRWVIDPLDGTNDFVAGLPTFGTCVTALRGDRPVVAAVHVPVTDDLYVARHGEGVRHDGDPVGVGGRDVDPPSATVGWVIGHGVKSDPEARATAEALRDALEEPVKRVIPSWSPVVHWGLLARGRIGGMVTYRADALEQHAGELLAEEAGAAIHRSGPLYVAAVDDDLRAELVETTEGLVDG